MIKSSCIRCKLKIKTLKKALFILLAIISVSTGAQNQDYIFEHLDFQNAFLSIEQDSKGYIWFGTYNGLWKYDGFDLVAYQSVESDSTTISNDEVYDIAQASGNILWIATERGFNRFNLETGSFERFFPDNIARGIFQRNSIFRILPDSAGNSIWLASRNIGLFKFDVQTRQSSYLQGSEKLSQIINSLAYLNSDTILVGSGNGVFLVQTRNGLITEPGNSFSGMFINEILPVSRELAWIGTDQGLFLFNIKEERILITLTEEAEKQQTNSNLQLNDNDIRALLKDSYGNLWVGTNEGGINIIRYNMATQTIESNISLKKDPNRPETIGTDVINTIFEDRNKNIWIGGERGSLSKFSPKKTKFNLYRNLAGNPNSLVDNSIRTVIEDSEGFLWVGTDNGLNKIDRVNNIYTLYQKNNINSIRNNVVKCLLERPNGDIWVGTDDGLDLYMKSSGQFRHFAPSSQFPLTYGNSYILSLYEEGDDVLWYGSWSGGLTKFEVQNRAFVIYKNSPEDEESISDNIVTSIYKDSKDNFWVGTSTGLNLFNREAGTFKRYLHPPDEKGAALSNFIWEIMEDSEGRLLVLSKNGIDVFDREKLKFTNWISKEDGLDIAFGMLEDSQKNLWISGTHGIVKLSLKSRDTLNYTRFSKSDGLQGDEFAMGAFYKSRKGEMFFGGPNGLNSFFPDEIDVDTQIPDIAITEFSIYNEPVSIYQEIGNRIILDKNIDYTKEIRLSHKENIFSFKFAGLHFVSPHDNKYAYMLEGLEKKWNYTDASMRYASYMNLPAGDYTFMVKAANCDGVWNENPVAIKLIITPPFYQTFLFKFLSVVTVLMLIYFLAMYRARNLIRQKVKLEKLVAQRTTELEESKKQLEINQEKIIKQNTTLEKQTKELSEQNLMIQEMAKKMHEADVQKLSFFTNISHEIRTPLSLILGPLKRLFDDKNENTTKKEREYYQLIERNSKRLMSLINQLMDFRKIEMGALKLSVSEIDMVEFFRRLVSSFSEVAERNQINLTFHSEIEKEIGYLDTDKFEKIIYNLLSNAFRFTPSEGKITVSYSSRREESFRYSRIIVSDTGIGIPENDLTRIFERFYQVNNQTSKAGGTGIGLSLTAELIKLHYGKISVDSKENKGSNFIVDFPTSREFYGEEEVQHEPADTQVIISNYIKKFPLDEISSSIQEMQQTLSETASRDLTSVLIVDDSPDIRKFLMLEFAGKYQIFEAADGQEGFDIAISQVPDLIIADIMMPVMDGKELCRKLKTDERTSHIPVILLTALSTEDQQHEGLETGADDYIAKPFNAAILVTKIQNILYTRKKQSEKFWSENSLYKKPKFPQNNPSDEAFLNKIFYIIDKNMDNEDMDNMQIAEELNISRAQLFRKIKSISNQTVSEFIYTYRLQKAAQLLMESGQTISEIAYAVGFKTPSHFNARFKKYFNLSPGEFRTRND